MVAQSSFAGQLKPLGGEGEGGGAAYKQAHGVIREVVVGGSDRIQVLQRTEVWPLM